MNGWMDALGRRRGIWSMETRIEDISATSKEIFSLTAQLSHTPGPAALHADIIAAIRESLRQLERDLAYAESFVEDVEDVDVRQEQRSTIARFQLDYQTHKRLYRKAVIKAKDNLQHDRKQKLLEMSTRPEMIQDKVMETRRSKRDANASSAVLQASSDVTAELRKTHALMSEELSRTALSQELLDESSATLQRLGEEYNTFGTILNGSKRLLKELENADRIDQLWIWGSFGFFCLVVSFILYRRILARPVNALIWTGSFMFSRVSQRKILQHNIEQQSGSIKSAHHSTTSGAAKSSADDIIDLIIPAVDQDDEAARIERARVNDAQIQVPKVRDEIVHVEL